MTFKALLEDREKRINANKKELQKLWPEEVMVYNEAYYQLDDTACIFYDFGSNYSDEQMYKNLKNKLGVNKVNILDYLSDTHLIDNDFVQNLYALRFIKRDSDKLNKQKRQLLNQVRRGFEVDYNSEALQMVLKK